MDDVVKALALVVQIAPAWVRVPAVAATKMVHWDGPLHIFINYGEGGLQNG